MRAWFSGDFHRCLELCDAVRPRDVDTVSQLALLRARALLRVGRDAEARDAINEVFVAHDTLDASLSAQMLLGTAEVALGDATRGLARLEAAQAAAAKAHPTIRSEIALRRARGYYACRDLERAEFALDQVDSDADIVFAQALNYRGWIQTARGENDRAAASFTASILHLDRCRHRDQQLEANALQALSHIAVERFDAPAWSFIEDRIARLDWSVDGLTVPHFWIAMAAAFAHETAGATQQAFAAGREAQLLAPSAAYRVHALCRRVALARNAGERYSAAVLLDEARTLFDTLTPDSLRGDERTVPLVLAEEHAHAGDVVTAQRFYQFHRALAPMERVIAMSADPRAAAYQRLVEATIADAAGEPAAAHRAYADAFRLFRDLRYTRRAVACALRLAQMTGHDYLYEYVVTQTRSVARVYWVRRAIADRERYHTDPVARRLTATERDVLRRVCAGRTNAQIARERGRSLNTVKHVVTSLLDAFGVRSRSALIVEAGRRSIVGAPHAPRSHPGVVLGHARASERQDLLVGHRVELGAQGGEQRAIRGAQ